MTLLGLRALSIFSEMSDLAELVNLGNCLKLVSTLAALALGYYTVNIYLVRRKYAHIPGPSSPGYVAGISRLGLKAKL